MLLAISAGNTNLKMAAHYGARWHGPWALPTYATNDIKILSKWYHNNVICSLPSAPEKAAFLSVVPSVTPIVEQFLNDEGIPCCQLTSDVYNSLGLGNSIPETTGADRIANVLAAKDRFGSPAIAVDFGTATTITAINAQGEFAGGAILPGVDLQIRSLNQGTAQLPEVPVEIQDSVLGRVTVSAIQSGVVKGHLKAVQGLLLEVCAELGVKPGQEPPIVCTGGRAAFYAEHSPLLKSFDPFLTFEGLRLASAIQVR
ncbi:MAG: type III pantothenate kinase [Fimbriimonadaceae bacterium]|nr:type III pantothenate kinase [Fimbriimonadaceae bacterium]